MDHVYWIIEDQLAGRPGPTRAPWDLDVLYAGGIRAIASVAADVDVPPLEADGFIHYQAKLPPMLLKTKGLQKAFIHGSSAHLALHPRAVRGWATDHGPLLRPATTAPAPILAGYLVLYEGLTPEAAIARLRAHNPRAMEAEGYADVVRHLTPGELPDPRTLL